MKGFVKSWQEPMKRWRFLLGRLSNKRRKAYKWGTITSAILLVISGVMIAVFEPDISIVALGCLLIVALACAFLLVAADALEAELYEHLNTKKINETT